MTNGTQVAVSYPLDALVSYHYYRDDKQMAALVKTGRLRMIGDSGAFSAFTQGTPIKMPDYVRWVRQWNPYLCWAASLDVIGDPAATLRNWRTMRDTHQLATVPTLHVSTDPRWMDAYVAEGCDFFGLGGMVGRAMQSLPWVVKVFRYARDHHPHARFHIWGITNRRFLDNLPAYSADSSGIFGSTYRYAQMRLFDPATGRHTTVQLRGNGVYKAARLLRHTYGINPGLITRSHPGNRHLLIQVAAAATQQYAAWLQRRHHVPPPTWALHTPTQLAGPDGGPEDAAGVRLHSVSAAAGRTVDDLEQAVLAGQQPETTGTRLHCVDGSAGNLLAAANTAPSEETT